MRTRNPTTADSLTSIQQEAPCTAVRAKTLIAAIAVAGLTLAASAFPGATTAATATQTFAPTADAYVNTTDTTNTGTSTNLYTDGSPVVYSYIRFNPSGLTGSTVTKATLRVFANTAGSSTQTYDVHTTTSSTWGESTITSANAPTFGLTIGSYGPIASGTWTSVDVTSAVQADSPVTFVLSTSGSTNIRYTAASPRRRRARRRDPVAGDCNSTGEHRGADDQRHRPARANADREQRQLERHHADQLQLRLAALRQRPATTAATSAALPRQTYTLVSGRRRHHDRESPSPPATAPATAPQLRPNRTVQSATPTTAPVNTVAPAISGTAQRGSTLTATAGSWSGSPTHLQLRVAALRSAAPTAAISGATSQTYTLVSGDVGTTIASP